jgi:hypothetical protein
VREKLLPGRGNSRLLFFTGKGTLLHQKNCWKNSVKQPISLTAGYSRKGNGKEMERKWKGNGKEMEFNSHGKGGKEKMWLPNEQR